MALEMYVKSRKITSLGTRNGQTGYYATPKQNQHMTNEKLLEHVVGATSLAKGDAKNCIQTFFEVACEALSDGASIDLGELGTLKVVVSSRLMDTPEEVTVKDALKTPKIQFIPKAKMLQAAKSVSVTIDHSFGEFATTGSSASSSASGETSGSDGGEDSGD